MKVIQRNRTGLRPSRWRGASIVRRLGLILLWVVLAWLGAAVLLGGGVYFFPRETLTIDSGDVHADAIVVLGGGRDERPARAARLFKQGAAAQILVSGSGECEEDVQILKKNGVPESVITREPDSTSTYENAEFSVNLMRKMGVHRAIIVTSWFHSRRALSCFQHCAPEMQFYSRPSYLTYQSTISKPEEVNGHEKSEYFKLLFYWVRYGVWPFCLS